MNKTVEKIINLINSKGIEQKTFAEAIGVKSNAISEWKSGKTKSYIKYIDKIADYLDVSVNYLLGTEEEEYADEIIILNRAAKKMSEEQRKQLLNMAKLMFKEAFNDKS